MRNKLVTMILVLMVFLILLTNFLASVSVSYSEESYNQYETRLIDDGFDDSILEYMNAGNLPSIASAIIKNDSIVWSKFYGYKDIKNKREATNETVYMLASISKTFTATAIMQLCEKGLLDLEDDINDYMPFSIRNPKYPEVPITIRMILSHRSSIAARNINLFTLFSLLQIPYEYLGEYLNPGGRLYSPKNWKDFQPGDGYKYSSTAYELLGYIVECVTNQTFPEYCEENIFTPLGMKNTSYYPSDFDKNQLANQYIRLLGRYISLPHFENRNYASGGLRSNLEDLSHLLIAYMNQGVYKGVRILENETVDEMFEPQDPEGRYMGYGLGFQIFSSHNNSGKNLRIGHNGGMPGSKTYMFYHVDDDFGLIILTNQHVYYTFRVLSSWFSIISLLSNKAREYE